MKQQNQQLSRPIAADGIVVDSLALHSDIAANTGVRIPDRGLGESTDDRSPDKKVKGEAPS